MRASFRRSRSGGKRSGGVCCHLVAFSCHLTPRIAHFLRMRPTIAAWMAGLLAGAGVLVAGAPAAAGAITMPPPAGTQLYDVDFEAETPGTTPSEARGPFPRFAIGENVFCCTTVVEGLGSNAGRALLFEADRGTDGQIGFFDLPGRVIELSFVVEALSLSVGNPAPSTFGLGVLFDAPSANSFRFQDDGVIRELELDDDPDREFGSRLRDIGRFEIGVPLAVHVVYDLDAELAVFRFGGGPPIAKPIVVGIQGRPPGLPDIRFGLQDLVGDTRFLVDDIRIRALPEPAQLALLVGVGLALARRFRERRDP